MDFQGDREGRPYNTQLPVLHVPVYGTGDPRGRPGRPWQALARSGSPIVALAIIRRPCSEMGQSVYKATIYGRCTSIYYRSVKHVRKKARVVSLTML